MKIENTRPLPKKGCFWEVPSVFHVDWKWSLPAFEAQAEEVDETEEQFLASLAKDEHRVHFGCKS